LARDILTALAIKRIHNLPPHLSYVCTLPDITQQEAQLSQRDRATLRVIEYFAKSLKIIQNDTVEYISISLKLCLCRTIYEIFTIKEWRDLETGSFKVIENGAVR